MKYWDALVMICGLYFIGRIIGNILFVIYKNHFHKFEGVAAVPYEEGCTHKDKPHNYYKRTLIIAAENLEPKDYLVCKDCGYIAGTEYQFNEEGRKLAAEKQARLAEIEAYEAARIKLLTDTIVNFFKAEDLPDPETYGNALSSEIIKALNPKD